MQWTMERWTSVNILSLTNFHFNIALCAFFWNWNSIQAFHASQTSHILFCNMTCIHLRYWKKSCVVKWLKTKSFSLWAPTLFMVWQEIVPTLPLGVLYITSLFSFFLKFLHLLSGYNSNPSLWSFTSTLHNGYAKYGTLGIKCSPQIFTHYHSPVCFPPVPNKP